MEDKKKLLINALIEKPSKYEIDVVDNSMLPNKLKKKKTLFFVIKPPTLEVLSKCVIPVLKIPNTLKEVGKEITIEEAIKYRQEMVEVLSILSHGKTSEHPIWYPDFFLKNLTAKDVYNLFYESILKLQTDFFLNSFQIVSQNNPMLMT